MTKLSEKSIDTFLKDSKKLKEYEPRLRKDETKSKIKDIFSLYKGPSPGYVKFEIMGTYSLRDLEKDSDTIDNWLSDELSDIQKKLPPSQRAGGFMSNGVYSNRFEDIAKHYIDSEGKEFQQYAASKGRDFYKLTEIKTGNIGDAVAAVEIVGNEATMYGARDFNSKAGQMAADYRIPQKWAERYVILHEMGHLAQKGKGYANHVGAELDNEHMLKGYFQEKAAMYGALAKVAEHRASNVAHNYGFGKGAVYNAPKAAPNYSSAKAA